MLWSRSAALHMAAKEGQTETLELLLKRQAHPDIATPTVRPTKTESLHGKCEVVC